MANGRKGGTEGGREEGRKKGKRERRETGREGRRGEKEGSQGQKELEGTSLVAQWLRIRLPTQGTWVQALAREDPTCRGATNPVRHNY